MTQPMVGTEDGLLPVQRTEQVAEVAHATAPTASCMSWEMIGAKTSRAMPNTARMAPTPPLSWSSW